MTQEKPGCAAITGAALAVTLTVAVAAMLLFDVVAATILLWRAL